MNKEIKTKVTKPRLTAFGKIKKWNEDRGLFSKEYNHKNEISFIIEEIIESISNIESKKARKIAKFITWLLFLILPKNSTKEQKVDAFADKIVFACGAIYKLGYDTDKVLKEVQKELDDRTGKLIDGKFVKDKKDTRYIADFTKCTL